jgi:hypothetical protein
MDPTGIRSSGQRHDTRLNKSTTAVCRGDVQLSWGTEILRRYHHCTSTSTLYVHGRQLRRRWPMHTVSAFSTSRATHDTERDECITGKGHAMNSNMWRYGAWAGAVRSTPQVLVGGRGRSRRADKTWPRAVHPNKKIHARIHLLPPPSLMAGCQPDSDSKMDIRVGPKDWF